MSKGHCLWLKINPRVLIMMAEWVNALLTFPRENIKIPTKLQNNYRWELPEAWLKRSPLIKDIKEKPR